MSDRQELERLISKYSPEVAKVARGALATLRRTFRGTSELVYDNYNALAIGWSVNGKASGVICSIALYPRWVSLFFLRGATLPDPDGRLRGTGKQVRSIQLESARTLDEPAVKRLIARAIAASEAVPASKAPPQTTIVAIVQKQRPRRP